MSHADCNFWWRVMKQTVEDMDLENAKVILQKIEQTQNEEKKDIKECNHSKRN
jgi:hypothetical protein